MSIFCIIPQYIGLLLILLFGEVKTFLHSLGLVSLLNILNASLFVY